MLQGNEIHHEKRTQTNNLTNKTMSKEVHQKILNFKQLIKVVYRYNSIFLFTMAQFYHCFYDLCVKSVKSFHCYRYLRESVFTIYSCHYNIPNTKVFINCMIV